VTFKLSFCFAPVSDRIHDSQFVPDRECSRNSNCLFEYFEPIIMLNSQIYLLGQGSLT
jgi:hypothetical protein